MSRSVWKFSLELAEVQVVPMPSGAQLLHVDMQGGTLNVWALVDPTADPEERKIAVVGTGHPAPSPGIAAYVGTAMDRPFVWHVFEELER